MPAGVMRIFSLHKHTQKILVYSVSYLWGTSTRGLSHVADMTMMTNAHFHLMFTEYRYKQYLCSSQHYFKIFEHMHQKKHTTYKGK